MGKSIIVINNQGKPRLVRFYYDLPLDRQNQITKQCYALVSRRSNETCCSFVEDVEVTGEDTKIIYQHFATLYFIFVVDGAESELGILDLIQVFVQALDSSFENVC